MVILQNQQLECITNLFWPNLSCNLGPEKIITRRITLPASTLSSPASKTNLSIMLLGKFLTTSNKKFQHTKKLPHQ